MKLYAVLAMLAATAIPSTVFATAEGGQTEVSMTVQGSSCSITSSSNANFGTLTNPITSVQYAQSNVYISCGSSSPAIKIAFNDASNTGNYNFTMTNSTVSSATQQFQICDNSQFSGNGTCGSGYEYKNTTSDAHSISSGTQNYYFDAYFVPPPAGLNLTGGTYNDAVTETITF